ncbi:succinate--CoA ligase subunit beta [Aetokthonos hydrillicola Thurmond2011]|jgi:succinyl-CoA synthetase beta subunit|uniref:Succinate--CoA ligase subunit beta n=1 Tax=Aetokthonos hydrillicola Thurmond2011 TaxID=2712845 RepID=A0AAP5MDX9_9CYAN|nr:succinate--CoA ligase subunit beta [Aetokthonos hydrillicola]MBO3457946.1 succinate--CoA ligase subunit beta [Aetokthonos hydrillicola CCALA 1050]MBW4587436.1 succinate--CoA ligase subunit beta [Aetokthonos hydrillicola CCALA 1050]MDR9900004.1 succinate--CoA ligase subunit beta [Aetokthonos hydrillicola Thurmond2011]
MDLLEYQVKEWFGKIGIPVLPSQRISHPTDLKRLKISYPIVLKSQVHASGREKAGGVRAVETTIDAIATAQNIFNLPILGELPKVLLAEAKYDAEQEFYLAVVLDTAVCRPVLLGCKEPDIDWESAGEKMQHVIVEQEFSPFYARQLAWKMGLQGHLMQSVSAVVEKMYHLFVEKDLDLVEINPLAVKDSGQVMTLNGSVSINERAIRRHPDIAEIAKKMVNRYTSSETIRNWGDWDGVELNGKIGILGNGAGSVMATLDLVASAGGKPGVCVNLRHASPINTSPTTFKSRLDEALKNLAADKSIQVILVNFLSHIAEAESVVEVIDNFVQQHTGQFQPQGISSISSINPRERNFPRLVLRLAGFEFDKARQYFAKLKIYGDALIVVDNLDEAVAEAVRLAKSTAYKRV